MKNIYFSKKNKMGDKGNISGQKNGKPQEGTVNYEMDKRQFKALELIRCLNDLEATPTDIAGIINEPGMEIPDSIDDIGPRTEYTLEDANAYLEELNKKYPIKEILGEYFDDFKNNKLWAIFDGSFARESGMEGFFHELVCESARAGKWVGLEFRNGDHDMKYIKNPDKSDRGLIGTIRYDALGFYGYSDPDELEILRLQGDDIESDKFYGSLTEAQNKRIIGDLEKLINFLQSQPKSEVKDLVIIGDVKDLVIIEDVEYLAMIENVKDYAKSKGLSDAEIRDMLPDTQYLNELINKRFPDEAERKRILGASEGLEAFKNSLPERKKSALISKMIFRGNLFGKPTVMAFPKEELIKSLINKLES